MRPIAARAAALIAILLLAASVAKGLPEAKQWIRGAYHAYAPLTAAERARSYGNAVPLDMEIFDFYKRHLRAGDRYYMQVLNSPFSTFADKRTVVTRVGRLYLLPAVQVERPAEADVILSFERDPAELGLRYAEQIRAGLQLIFVSRVAR